jgi:hypothetical protein
MTTNRADRREIRRMIYAKQACRLVKEFVLDPLSALPELRAKALFGGFRQD